MSSKTDSLRPRLAEHNQNRPAVRPLLVRNFGRKCYRYEVTEFIQGITGIPDLLDDRLLEEIMRLAEEYGCGKTILLFQILLDYCCAIAPAVLDEQMLKSLGVVN